MLRSLALGLSLCSLFPLALPGQRDVRDVDQDKARAAVATAVRLWVDDYEHDRLFPHGPLRPEAGLQPRYVAVARAAALLSEKDLAGLTHLDALQKLLFFAENHPDEAIGEGLLALAAAGLDKSLVDRDAMLLRDLGHCTLLRCQHNGIWFMLMRTAAGRQWLLPAAGDAGDEPAQIAPQLRVAALALLGQRALPVARSTIEGCLADGDPRVRLGAVEAIECQRRPESLSVLLRSAGSERHPVVAQALVRALLATLKSARSSLPRDEVDRAVGVALHLLGQCGWRTDMDVVELVEEFPQKAAIPLLIGLLEPRNSADDKLVAAVNRRASPLLRERAWDCLRLMTGAILPIDQPKQWRQFWQQEQDRIVVPETLHRDRGAATTRGAFFGIPVTGREIAFVIDTSGSMEKAFGPTAGESGRARAAERAPSRLGAAKEQLLLCVQAMDPDSRYHLLTFSNEAHVWSRQPVPPSASATRALTEVLSRLQPNGGTNLYDGLAQALSLDGLRFGQVPSQQVDELFLLSDGEPTLGVREPEQILRLVREANKYLKVRINAVFAGSGSGAGFLRRLAEENGGVFVQR